MFGSDREYQETDSAWNKPDNVQDWNFGFILNYKKVRHKIHHSSILKCSIILQSQSHPSRVLNTVFLNLFLTLLDVLKKASAELYQIFRPFWSKTIVELIVLVKKYF